MKFKKATFLDQHVEKIVMAVAGLFALIVLVVFVLMPYRVDVPEIGAVRPGEIGNRLAETVRQLEERAERQDVQAPADPEYGRLFELALGRPVLPLDEEGAPRVERPIGPGRPGLGPVEPTVREPERYALATPTAPQIVEANVGRHFLSSLGEEEQELEQQVMSLVGGQRDFTGVHVLARWDYAEWVESLESQDVPADQSPIPQRWRERVLFTDAETERRQPVIVDVALERERYDPQTGEWTDSVTIDRLPGEEDYNFRGRPAADESRRELERALMDAQAAIRVSPFIPVAYEWPAATMDLSASRAVELQQVKAQLDELRQEAQQLARADEDEVEDIRRRFNRLVQRHNRIVEEFRTVLYPPDTAVRARDEQRRPGQQRRPEQFEPRRRDIWDEFDERSQRPGGDRAASQPRMAERPARDSRSNTRLVAMDHAQASPWDEGMEERGGGWDEFEERPEERRPDERRPQQRRPQQQRGVDLQPEEQLREFVANPIPDRPDSELIDPEAGQMELWTHDATARPGQRYRYRMVVSVLNPLFDQAEALHEDQQPLAEELGVRSEASPWQEVELDPQHYYFLVDTGGQTATFEIWQILQRFWRGHEFRASAGDPVGGEAEVAGQQVELRVPVMLVDVLAAGDDRDGGGAQAILVDTRDQQVKVRDAARDEQSPDRIRLKMLNEAWQAAAGDPQQREAARSGR